MVEKFDTSILCRVTAVLPEIVESKPMEAPMFTPEEWLLIMCGAAIPDIENKTIIPVTRTLK